MDNSITRAELIAYTESNIKTATALEKIAGIIEASSESLTKINTRLYNGLGKEIIESVSKQCISCTEDNIKSEEDIKLLLKEIKENTIATRSDSNSLKLFVGVISVIIIVVTSIVNVIVRGADTRMLLKSNFLETTEEHQNLQNEIKKEIRKGIADILKEESLNK